MNLSPDQIIFWQMSFVKLNATIVFTWIVMMLLVIGSILITRKLSKDMQRSRWQNLLEVVVITISKQIEEVGLSNPHKYLGFLGSLFLFIATSAICTVIPGFEPPTGSLSSTVALALCVFVAVPMFGIEKQGLRGYLASYTKPTVIMLPFNLISEVFYFSNRVHRCGDSHSTTGARTCARWLGHHRETRYKNGLSTMNHHLKLI